MLKRGWKRRIKLAPRALPSSRAVRTQPRHLSEARGDVMLELEFRKELQPSRFNRRSIEQAMTPGVAVEDVAMAVVQACRWAAVFLCLVIIIGSPKTELTVNEHLAAPVNVLSQICRVLATVPLPGCWEREKQYSV